MIVSVTDGMADDKAFWIGRFGVPARARWCPTQPCRPPPQDVSVTSPSTPRSAVGFDLRWRDIADAGSPIDAAHYQVLDGSGKCDNK